MTAERPYRAPDVARGRVRRARALRRARSSTPRSCAIFCEEVRKRPISDDDEAVAAALAADPELQLRRLEDEPLLGQGPLAVTDNLTLLYSHRYFHEVAAKEAERARVQDDSFGVVLVEPNDIAQINRSAGLRGGRRGDPRGRDRASSAWRCASAARRAATAGRGSA